MNHNLKARQPYQGSGKLNDRPLASQSPCEGKDCRRRTGILSPFLVAMAALVLLLAPACGGGGDELLVFAAASLRDVVTPLGEEFQSEHNIKVRFSFAGSVTLSQQLLRGAPGDLFIAAGADPMDRLDREGLLALDSRRVLLTNQLVLVAPTDTKDGRATLDEALANSNRIALADPQLAPAGQYAREALQSLGLWDELKPKMVFGGDVRTSLAYVESGNADVGLVYQTDAMITSKVRVAQVVPAEFHSAIIYPVAVLERSDRKEAAVKFLAFLQQDAAAAQFHRHGFGVPKSP